jgi:3-oxoacyl-(acyl-carrier-protein) synthase
MAAKDTSELFRLSRFIITVAFRLGAEVQRRAQLVEGSGRSWGRTYIGLDKGEAQKILDRFHELENIPPPRQVAVGVVSDSWLTLVGAPSSLERLAGWSPEIGAGPSLETSIPGPIHSRCLPAMDASKIVGSSPIAKHPIDTGAARKAHLYSPGSLKRYEESTLGPLLEHMVEDIAHNVLQVSSTIQDCVGRLDQKGSYKLSVMGPTNHLAAMERALKSQAISFHTEGPSTGITEDTGALAEACDATRGGSDLIAVVGMAGRFPGSDSVEAFWEDLVAGKSQVREIPKSRFDIDAYFDPTGAKKNSTASKYGCFLDRPGLFDHRLFNISPREAAQMDPAHRLLLTIGYEALQQAGYNPQCGPSSGSSRMATYFGQAADEWQEVLSQKGADIYYVPGFSRAFGPARLHYQFKWSGPSYALDSACSTSATAVSLACAALAAREIDTALAGGASVLTSPNTFSGLSRAGMLSTTEGGCKTFHDAADGYCRAEGAGVVVLKRLEDAVRDNDNVLAVVRGSARTYSAAASSMTHPSAEAQEDTYLKVLRQSCLPADEIAYVEMHGTGTQAGDVEEMASVSSLSRSRTRDNPLTVGAVKAAVGHGEGVSYCCSRSS